MPRLEHGSHEEPLQLAEDSSAMNAVDRRATRLQRSAAVLACFCSMVQIPQIQQNMIEICSVAASTQEQR